MKPALSNQPEVSTQSRALGSYRHDVAYTAALKSCCRIHALGSYRHDVAYTAALKSSPALQNDLKFTGVEHCLAPVIFLVELSPVKGLVA